MNTFNKLIKELRKDLGKTQKEIAEILGISTTCYAGYEQGGHEPCFEILVKLSRYFDVSTDYLLGVTQDDGAERLSALTPTFLSLEERTILNNYHALSHAGKARVVAYTDFIREQEEGDKRQQSKP